MATSESTVTPVKEDRWIPSACSMCYSCCSIMAHVVDGRLVKIEGNPNSTVGEGRLCSKGVAGIMMLYDPNRLNVPLKRTNPQKGIGIDPGWKEITWDEALDTVTAKLKPILEDDPRKLFLQGTTTANAEVHWGLDTFGQAFGTDSLWVGGGGIHCGSGAHELNGLMHASWSLVPDFKLCNYALYFGASKGHSAGHVANQNAQLAADARARGMKLVVVDPMCNFASGKANEWVPIRVGTDAALALSMCNVLVNELGVYDRKYLRLYTNAPYLVQPDGHYKRDQATNKPLVWDETSDTAKTFDDPSIGEYAIEGRFTVDGVECQPGFQLLKEHLKKFTPEWASQLTTIRQTTIRRLAKEWAEHARIGSTIVIDGKELPYRPVAAVYFRGSQGHRNSTWNCLSIELLNQLVGAADVPGGALGFNPVCHGYPETGSLNYTPTPCPDGLMITGAWRVPHKPYPAPPATAPKNYTIKEIFPWAMISPFLGSNDQEEWWSKFNIESRPQAMINFGANAVMSVGNKDVVAEALKKIPFIVSFDIFLNEMTDFADIVLPDMCYLERHSATPNYPFIFNHPAGMGDWGWAVRQPTVATVGKRRDFIQVLYDLGERLGLREPLNIAYNVYFKIEDPYKLKPSVKYEHLDVLDRALKSNFGEGHGLGWFKENGVLRWPKKAEEVYWRTFVPVRVPIYFEMFLATGEEVGKIASEYGVEMDLWTYTALPDWHPCASHEVQDPRYDMWSFYYRDILHTNSLTMENPWLDEAAQMNAYSYFIAINADMGKKKGLKDGDTVWVESAAGRKIKGRVKLTEGIHPEGLGVAALCGHWSKDQPIARGKGVFYNDLIEVDYKHMDPGNLNMDLCAKVRVYKE